MNPNSIGAQPHHLDSYLKATSGRIEQALNHLIKESPLPYQSLFKAARYALLGPGKRLRPILTLATTEAFGADLETAVVPACALEMIHTYSMIHDDLPAMDNDDYRRGKLTVHKAFNEALAVLSGDFLLTYAFEVITEASHLTADQKLKLVAVLAKRSGAQGMIGGQVMDIEAENSAINYEQLRYLHRCKTGALISAAVEFGGIIANVNEEQMHLLKSFAEDIGLAFQIVDDILDVTAPEKKHGQKSSDIINKKMTYVSLLGLDQAKDSASSLLASAKEKLQKLKAQNTSTLLLLADFIVNRNH